MKKIITVLGILALIGAFAVPVMAHGTNWGRGGHMMDNWGRGGHMMDNWGNHPGYGYQGGMGFSQLNEKQREELTKLDERFYTETKNLRDQYYAKSVEFETAFTAETPDRNKINGLQKELSEIQANLDQARIEYELEARKIVPGQTGRGGYSQNWMGNRGGYSAGGCW
jgi:Spy/CpxP family protein refolding chaperone